MIVIAVGQFKGGVGKTTLAINIAGEINRFGRSVVVFDADPQGSATKWAALRKLTFVVRHELLSIRNTLVWIRNILKSKTDFVVIDIPSGAGIIFDTAVLIADLLVVPCGPSSLDLNSAAATITKARQIRRDDDVYSHLKIVTVATKIDLSTEEGHHISEELEDLGETVGPPIGYDMDYVRSFTAGIAVASLPEGTKATDEIRQLSLFLLKQVAPRQFQ